MPRLFTATGCMRCKIVKAYMAEHQIVFEELDINTNGKDPFKEFYRKNRPDIFRGLDGIEFPILFADGRIYQGVGIALAYLMAEERLDGFVFRSDLSHGWISGINISAKPLADGKTFLSLLEFLKDNGLMIQLETDGRNPLLLETALTEKWVHRLIFNLLGPADLYTSITGFALPEDELLHSLSVLTPSIDYQIILPISLIPGKDGESRYLSPEEAARAAELVEKATGSKKHPFFIREPAGANGINIAPLQQADLFKYRTLCRRHMVLCDILKGAQL